MDTKIYASAGYKCIITYSTSMGKNIMQYTFIKFFKRNVCHSNASKSNATTSTIY